MNYLKLEKGIAVLLAMSFLFVNPALAQPRRREDRRRKAVPANLVDKAVVPGFKDIRTFADVASPVFEADLIKSIKEEPAGAFPVNADGKKEYVILAISGGGANGAYGAGIINGWTKNGTRPNFKMITGISTGALIAPFAFLGEDYDDELKRMYTTMSTEDIMRSKAVVNVKGVNSLADNAGLQRIIENNVTEEILAAVAEEHKKGKRLYVCTTNLDTKRLVVWDMGKIAQVGNKKALTLFQDILLASAAIPMIFPPMYIDVVVDREKYKEIHVDGGTVTQVSAMVRVFGGLREALAKEGIDRSKKKVTLYLIRNGYVTPHWSRVRNNLTSIAESSMDTMITNQGIGDIYRIHALTKLRDIDFNLAYIPVDYVPAAKEMFDTEEMIRLFDLGFDEASKGYPWKKKPPYMKEIKNR
ncbi:patatin-like phospholipase family protein [Candidatus Omnitrophota bacterium]